MNIDDLLRAAVAKGASDLHVKVGAYPMARVAGVLVPVSEEKRLMNEDTLAMGAQMMSSEQRDKFTKSQEVDLAYSVPGLGRFRVNVFQQRGGPAGSLDCQTSWPVFLSYAWNTACPPEPSPAKRKFFVTSNPAWDGLPVGGTFVKPAAARLFAMLGGVPPLGICHATDPRFIS